MCCRQERVSSRSSSGKWVVVVLAVNGTAHKISPNNSAAISVPRHISKMANVITLKCTAENYLER